mmetsp:Transcript_21515/g.54204  ORF Transcript_21515/g.54204 Transcript_21515/m.54204 type:complete len:471 (-) Transcript_21515:100-1512(-)|eukprot:CAMPEP_0178986900 /NCGR_PEP_ID=MMETSP0795-20121207/2961_1 /TAXON_ID=88552 /ORGANISM="Amoebophrya sp., Strain Ameob2" /LENGTH=470 /DNA_ID=CAMNT_0020678013 /DNA_START=363 /DNA_END=1775 /DNA_ORIENTATION=-
MGAAAGGGVGPTWRELADARIKLSWAAKPRHLIWLEDKALQVAKTQELIMQDEQLRRCVLELTGETTTCSSSCRKTKTRATTSASSGEEDGAVGIPNQIHGRCAEPEVAAADHGGNGGRGSARRAEAEPEAEAVRPPAPVFAPAFDTDLPLLHLPTWRLDEALAEKAFVLKDAGAKKRLKAALGDVLSEMLSWSLSSTSAEQTGGGERRERPRPPLQAVVVKPRNGHDGLGVTKVLLEEEGEQGQSEDQRISQIDRIYTALHKAFFVKREHGEQSWLQRENWQLSQVPDGVVLQPLYSTSVIENYCSRTKGPLELKVHVIHGVVACATLKQYSPQVLYLEGRQGKIKLFQGNGTGGSFDGGENENWEEQLCRFAGNITMREVHAVKDFLETEIIGKVWESGIVPFAERFLAGYELDECRFDFLLGDTQFGVRLGEITHQGAAFATHEVLSRACAEKLMRGVCAESGKGEA